MRAYVQDDIQGALDVVMGGLELLPTNKSLRFATDNLQEISRLGALKRSIRVYSDLLAKVLLNYAVPVMCA